MLYSIAAKSPLSLCGKNAGKISGIYVDYESGKICGLKLSSFFNLRQEAVAMDKVDFLENKIICEKAVFEKIDSEKQGEIIKFRVFTKSRCFLGKVRDFEFDPANFKISSITVRNKATGEAYFIDRNQIIVIEEGEIVVEDGLTKEAIPDLA